MNEYLYLSVNLNSSKQALNGDTMENWSFNPVNILKTHLKKKHSGKLANQPSED